LRLRAVAQHGMETSPFSHFGTLGIKTPFKFK